MMVRLNPLLVEEHRYIQRVKGGNGRCTGSPHIEDMYTAMTNLGMMTDFDLEE